jgi:hypothetical protein
MSLTTVVLITLIPALLIPGYGAIKLQSTLMREGMWAGFVGGVGVALAVWLWQQILNQALPSLPIAPIGFTAGRALLAALPDEVCKFFLLLALIRYVVRIADIRDIILTSLGISLAFAVVKDAALLIEACARGPLNLTPDALLRLVSVVPEHGITGLAMGVLVAHASRFATVPGKGLPQALLVPLLIHAGHDFLLMLNQHGSAYDWTPRVLPAAAAASVLLTVTMCNAVIPRRGRIRQRPGAAATRAPVVSGFPALPGHPVPEPAVPGPAMSGCALPGGAVSGPAALGIILLIAGAGFFVPMLFNAEAIARHTVLSFVVVPLILGIDLLPIGAGHWRLVAATARSAPSAWWRREIPRRARGLLHRIGTADPDILQQARVEVR